MFIQERIAICRLSEEIRKNKDFCKEIGLFDTTVFKEDKPEKESKERVYAKEY